MQYQYVVSAHKASSVTASVSGAFVAPHETNLILAKGNRLEIHTLSSHGLVLLTEQAMFGRITSLHFFHPSDRLTGLVLVTSDRQQFAVLSWDAASQTLVTESSGSTVERTGRPATETCLVSVDPESRMVAMYWYQGIVHLFQMAAGVQTQGRRGSTRSLNSGHHQARLTGGPRGAEDWPYAVREDLVGGLMVPPYLKEDGRVTGDSDAHPPQQASVSSKAKGKAVAFAVRSGELHQALVQYIQELKVLDMQFLRTSGKQSPTLAVLYEDANMTRQVHVYRVGETQGELQLVSHWISEPVDQTVSHIVALANGAILAIGDESIMVVAQNTASLSMSMRAASVTAWDWIDKDSGERLLLADDEGVLSLVVLKYASSAAGKVKDLYVERLGDISVASSLTYLSGGCVYIGSHFGDQELVRLHTQALSAKDIENSGAQVLDPWSFDTDALSNHPLANVFGKASAVADQSQAGAATFIEPLESFPNLAPIMDLCMVGMSDQQQQKQQSASAVAEHINESTGHSQSPMAIDSDQNSGPASNGNSHSHGSIVTCSGMRNKPSLRVVRNGVGIDRITGLDIEGLLGVWSFTAQVAPDSARVVVLALSLFNQTLVLGWTEPSASNEIELAELDVAGGALPGWRTNELTLAVGLTKDQAYVIQVTPSAVMLISIAGGWQQQATWVPGNGMTISIASIAGDQIALVVGGKTVGYLEVQGASLVPVMSRELEQFVSCIDVHSWGHQDRSSLVAVGLWGTNDVQLLQLPSLLPVPIELSLGMRIGSFTEPPQAQQQQQQVMAPTAATGCDLPRSILMCMLGGTSYLLVGLGDGRLHHFALRHRSIAGSQSELFVAEHKSVALGTRPISLTPFANHGTTNVFAASDHSAVLFASKRGSVRRNSSVGVEMAESTRTSKLMYANVDASDVSFVAPIMSLSFPDALCLVTTTQLSIGTIDPVQKLHIRSTPLPKWAAPHRVVHNVAHGTFGVATVHAIGGTPAATSLATWEALGPAETNEQQMKMLGDVRAPLVSSPPVEAGRFSVINAQTMEVQSTLLLRPYELPESLCVAPALMCLERTGKAAMEVDGGGGLENVFVLGTSIVMPNEDDAHRGRILVMQWDAQMQRTRIIGSFTTHGAVYALRVFRGMLLAAVNNRLLLLGWQRRTHKLASNTRMGREGDRFVTAEDAEYELVVLYSQQTQIVTVSLTVSGDYVAAGDLMSSVSVYRYEENLVDDKVERRMTPVTRDYAAAWVSAVATAPGPLVQNLERVFPDRIPDEVEMAGRVKIGEYSRVFQDPGTERFVVADSFNNLYRVARAASNGGGGGGGQQDGQQDQRLAVEGRWHLGDMVNCIRPGSLVMDIPDPEFPELFRPLLVYGTIMGAVGVVASVEDGKLGRILDRLQTNLAHLVPTPGMWSYDRWRGYQTNQRQTRAFGFLDGDLIERLLDLSPHVQMLVVTGGSALLGESQVDRAEWRMKSRSCAGFARVEGECDVEILGCQAVSNIVKREGVSVEYVVRLVESLSRLH